MLKINRLLFATDFSPGAKRAWDVTRFVAERYGADVVLAHVETGAAAAEDIEVEDDESLTSRVQELATTSAPVRGVRVKANHVATGILHLVNEMDVDLVAMGTHGRRGVRRLLIGSVAEEVVRLAPCPVLTTRQIEEELNREVTFESILVPVDFSSHARLALLHAVQLARTTGASLHVLHIIEHRAMPRVYNRGPATLSLANVKEQSARAMREMVEREFKFHKAEVHVKVGYASDDIVDWADENDNDLIIIASHGRSNIERMLLGSVTQRVVRLANSPVLTVKSFGKQLATGENLEGDWSLGDSSRLPPELR